MFDDMKTKKKLFAEINLDVSQLMPRHSFPLALSFVFYDGKLVLRLPSRSCFEFNVDASS
jgi:hypothetical protein